MKNLFLIMVLFSFPLISNASDESYFCSECTSNNVAKEVARLQYAPRLQCYPANPGDMMDIDNMICSSISKEVVLVNPDTKASYKFLVGHSNNAPIYSPIALDRSMTTDERNGYKHVANMLAAYNHALEYSSGAPAMSGYSSIQSTGSCPSDTALSHIVDPNNGF
ncbi:hypothetical protein [Ferrimonas balearica]|uniref:hypothetical protein n=1 Tax=Ferrimonas balearica TaxID=44012 RepID=UPI001C978C1A|nr:hypothetical protein [Ferrimonas balearica]MBY6226253.1 hypothetical protein [Ferrimonas balearica]